MILHDRCTRETFIEKLTEVQQTVSSCLAQLQASEHDSFAAEILDVQIIVRSQQVRSTLDAVDLKPVIVRTPKLAQS